MTTYLYPENITALRTQIMAIARRLRREAGSDDASWARLLLLGAIDRHGGTATPSLLAAAEGMRSSNLAAALRDLETRGLILRTPDTEDRRKVRVSLTAAGLDLLHDDRARHERWLAETIDACLTEIEQTYLIEAGTLLDRLARHGSGKQE
jgi:DNA-binding MarR family transcriptional regulator